MFNKKLILGLSLILLGSSLYSDNMPSAIKVCAGYGIVGAAVYLFNKCNKKSLDEARALAPLIIENKKLLDEAEALDNELLQSNEQALHVEAFVNNLVTAYDQKTYNEIASALLKPEVLRSFELVDAMSEEQLNACNKRNAMTKALAWGISLGDLYIVFKSAVAPHFISENPSTLINPLSSNPNYLATVLAAAL